MSVNSDMRDVGEINFFSVDLQPGTRPGKNNPRHDPGTKRSGIDGTILRIPGHHLEFIVSRRSFGPMIRQSIPGDMLIAG